MRKLKADEIECRVAQVGAKGCTLLLYKTARTDATILTEEYGDLWQNDFKVIDGKMYGGIGVFNKELNQWIWRWDAGIESNTEAVKGEASDCFKRAGFKFLIGQELYKAPFIFVSCETTKNGNKYELVNKYVKYQVLDIGYADNGDINKLKIADDKGVVVFELGKYTTPPKEEKKPTKKKQISDADMEYINNIKEMTDVNDIKAYYQETKEHVEDRETYHSIVCERVKALKGE